MLDTGFLQPEVQFYPTEMLTFTGVKAEFVFSLELVVTHEPNLIFLLDEDQHVRFFTTR